MAGILPMAKHDGELYFLFGRERRYPKWRDSKLWSDFGGAIDKGETKMDAAIREGYEEMNGFLGSIEDMKRLMHEKLVTVISSTNYATFIVEIDYSEELANKFATLYDDIYKNDRNKLLKRDGMYEKDMAKWVSYKELQELKKESRVFYKKNISYIIKYFKYIKNKM